MGSKAKLTVPIEHAERELGKETVAAMMTKPAEVEEAPKSEACSSCTQSKSACATCGESIVLGGGEKE